MRADAHQNSSVVDPEAFAQASSLSNEIADVLRRNIVQAVKVAEAEEGQEKWRMHNPNLVFISRG